MRRIPWLMLFLLPILVEVFGKSRPVYRLPAPVQKALQIKATRADTRKVKKAASKIDIHGGIKMGINNGCDDGKTGIEIDWDPDPNSKKSKEEYTCPGRGIPQARFSQKNEYCTTEVDPPTHVCINEKITYKDRIPTSGSHRPVWPVYGEYRYLPPQRWLHSLEHGAVVVLYHPCAYNREVDDLKNVVKSCLRRYVITPSKRLSTQRPYAVLTYGCKLEMSQVDTEEVQIFIKEHALNATEKVARDGDYDAGLKEKSKTVSDENDSKLCPNFKAKVDKSWDRVDKPDFAKYDFDERHGFGKPLYSGRHHGFDKPRVIDKIHGLGKLHHKFIDDEFPKDSFHKLHDDEEDFDFDKFDEPFSNGWIK